MDNQIFRKKSLEQISSPEQLHDYLHVTNPAVWLVLTAVILLLVGGLIWSSFATINTFVTGTAEVHNGSMMVSIDDSQMADQIKSGMTVLVGDTKAKVTSVGHNAKGGVFAVAQTDLADGSYPAKIALKQTQVLSLLFN